MAIHTLGTNATTTLSAVAYVPGVLSAADLATIANSIVPDGELSTSTTAFIGLGAPAIYLRGTEHSNTTLDGLTANSLTSSGAGAIQIGALVIGSGIPLNTFVVAMPTATSVTLSQAATSSTTGGVAFINPRPNRARFSFNGQLEIPGRGILNLKPGDVVAIDLNGFPYLVPNTSIGVGGGGWTFV